MESNIGSSKAIFEARLRSVVVIVLKGLEDDHQKNIAYEKVSAWCGVSQAALWRWTKKVEDLPLAAWEVALTPKYKRSCRFSDFIEITWHMISSCREAHFLNLVFISCEKLSIENGWSLPNSKTIECKIKAKESCRG